jgi:hypothetical protein
MKIRRSIMRAVQVLLPCVLAGCASGFDRGAIAERLEGQARVVNDAAVLHALQVRPQLRFPIKVAVFLAAESGAPAGSHRTGGPEDPGWKWSV